MNIILIGMPACGKSTIGVILAKVLGYRFLDTDLVIQDLQQKTLEELISIHGMEGFLSLEEDTISHIETDRTVIATGGSVVYGQKAMQHLKENGTVFYIHNRYEVIASRIENIKTRGVAIAKGKTLRDLYEERSPLYLQYADKVIEADGLGTEEIIGVIKEQLS